MHFTFDHNNFNVADIEKSIRFYEEALSLSVTREKLAKDGSYKLVYMGDGKSPFLLELTWMRDFEGTYDLGDEEFHVAFKTDDYEAALKKHTEMDCVAFVNEQMGIYFIQDPDGYWIEIIPA